MEQTKQPSQRPRLPRWAGNLLKIGATALILGLLVKKLDFEKLEAVWVATAFVWLIPVMLVKAAGIFSSILRWRWLLRGQGLEVPLSHLVGSFLVGRFIGMVVPSTLGLDGYRAYDIAKHANAPAKSIAVIIVEKVIGLFGIGILVLATLPGGKSFVPGGYLISLGVIVGLPVLLAFYLLVHPGAVQRLSQIFVPEFLGLRRKIGVAAEAAGAYAQQKGVLAAATGFGILVHVSTATMYLFTARAVGADVTPSEVLFAAPLMIVATLVPISLSGFGVREGVFVAILAQVGVPVEQAALLGTLGFIGGEAFSLVGGIVFLARRQDYAPQIEELEAGVRAVDLIDEDQGLPGPAIEGES